MSTDSRSIAARNAIASLGICFTVSAFVPLEKRRTPRCRTKITRRRTARAVDQRGGPIVEIARKGLEQTSGTGPTESRTRSQRPFADAHPLVLAIGVGGTSGGGWTVSFTVAFMSTYTSVVRDASYLRRTAKVCS